MAKIVSERLVFETPWFKVLSQEVEGVDNGDYYTITLADYANVLALTGDREVLLVRQFRPAVRGETLELPGGHVDPGEAPQQTIQRELLEETGYHSDELELLGCLKTDTGRLANRMWCFAARNARQISSQHELETIRVPVEEFEARIAAGSFDFGLHIAVYCLAVARGFLKS